MKMFDLFGNSITIQTQCKVSVQQNALQIITPYNSRFVALVKSLPSRARQFDPNRKAWLIDTQYAKQVRQWILDCYGEDIGEIDVTSTPLKTETRVCDVWYLGRTKSDSDERVASGMNKEKKWVYIFPECVLREWFEGTDKTMAFATTLYGILGIQRTANNNDEIKSAYRRVAKQWHPDICKEPNAQEVFIQIKEAYEILSDPQRRTRYNAGLALEASLRTHLQDNPFDQYRSPLRCGYILAEGYERMGRFIAQKIIDWQDITSEWGTLTVSWPSGASEPVWQWI